MGVTGLWNLVDSVGHPISLETLHNQILAIDLSIWVNQSIKGFRDREGRVLDNAHVLGLFHRICKLLFYKIKPVFVFDGSCPQLKRRTIERRHEQRLKAIDRSRQGSVKILQDYIASQLSTRVEEFGNKESLPLLESSLLDAPKDKSVQMYEQLIDLHRSHASDGFDDSGAQTDETDSDYEPNIAHNYRDLQNIDSIDINSDQFLSLPPDIRYEILTELKQKYKGYLNRNTEVMPKESNDFSSYQMQRLLKKRSLQHKIEETIKLLNSQSSDDVIQEWNEKEFFVESEAHVGQLMSDENTRFILLKKSQTITSNNNTTDIDHKLHVNNEMNDISVDHSMSSCDKDLKENSKSNNSTDSKEVNQQFIRNALKRELNNQISHKIENKEKLTLISDESDVEVINELKEQNYKPIKPIDKKISDSNEKSKEFNNEFTQIKAIEVSSETSDDDFEEVGPQSPDSIDQLMANINQKDLQNLISKTNTEEINSQDSALNLIDTIAEKDLKTVEKDLKTVEKDLETVEKCDASHPKSDDCDSHLSDKNVSQNSPLKSVPSSSQSIPFERISREEVLETHREVNKQNRYANNATDKMMTDCQQLLKLFGVPFIISPMEAEAQCAALEELGLTSGTITDDSDVLLFGAQTVYKNFFTSSKFVELYKSCDIESRFGLSRSAMICIAMLCGSDYTDGVDGVGAVKAAEILSEFPGDGLQPLIDFKNWWTRKNNSKDKRPENNIKAKLMKLRLNESFPNKVIFDAYMNPIVDKSEEPFSWSMPRLDDLRKYASDWFGWSFTKTDQILLPVIKKVNEKQTQMTIDNYFKIQTQPKDTSTLSKRLNKAIEKLRGVESEPQSSHSQKGSSGMLSQKVKNQRRKRVPNKDHNKEKPNHKRLNVSKSRPQVVNLSESSESD